MQKNDLTSKSAWHNRWSTPNEKDLVAALKPHHRRVYLSIMQKLEATPGLDRTLIWYGPSWKWTFQFKNAAGTGPKSNGDKSSKRNGKNAAKDASPLAAGQPDVSSLCYLVPDANIPLFCIPMTSEFIESLPLKRLPKFIKEGIRLAKCAVEIHWATWTPISELEVQQLLDIVHRRQEYMTGSGKHAHAAAPIN